jgi:hypothetical protein
MLQSCCEIKEHVTIEWFRLLRASLQETGKKKSGSKVKQRPSLPHRGRVMTARGDGSFDAVSFIYGTSAPCVARKQDLLYSRLVSA